MFISLFICICKKSIILSSVKIPCMNFIHVFQMAYLVACNIYILFFLISFTSHFLPASAAL